MMFHDVSSLLLRRSFEHHLEQSLIFYWKFNRIFIVFFTLRYMYLASLMIVKNINFKEETFIYLREKPLATI